MLNLSNTAPRSGRPSDPATVASSGHGFSRAVQTRPGEPYPFALLSKSRCPRHASAKYSALRVNGNQTPKLVQGLTYTKHSTSHFLIDNFRASAPLAAPTTPRRSERRREQATPKAGLPAVALAKVSPASSPQPPPSSTSNRPHPRLEMPVSYRKQTVGPISNRPQFALCNFPLAAQRHVSARSGLPAAALIANEMHSREMSSPWKQMTYEMLIANEFHSLREEKVDEVDRNSCPDSVESRASFGAKIRRKIPHIGDSLRVH